MRCLGTQAAFEVARLLISVLILMIACEDENLPKLDDDEAIRRMLNKTGKSALTSKILEGIAKHSLVWRQLELGPNVVQAVRNILANL